MKCKTCAHPQFQAIDLALLTRTHTLEALSQQYGLTVSSLHRHKRHLVKNLDQARDRLQNLQQLGQLLKLNGLLDQVERAVNVAEAKGNIDRVIRGAGVGARLILQMSRLDVPLDLDTVHRIISSPQWVSQASLLPTDPQLITGLHQALADIALCTCPDPDPESAAADDGKDNEDYRTIPATINSELLPVAADGLETSSAPENRPPAALPAPRQRQTSAKLPNNPSSRADNNVQNQSDNQCEKFFAPNPPSDPENRPAPPCPLSATLPAKTPPLKKFIPQYQSASLWENDSTPNLGNGRESDAPPPLQVDINPPPPLAKVSPYPAQANVPQIDNPQTETGHRPTAFQTENRTPDTGHRPLETPLPPGLTPALRAQIFTQLFPQGNGAREPEKIAAPAEKPAAKPPSNPSPKKGALSKLLSFFRRKPASSSENALISPQARPAGRESHAPFSLNEFYQGYQRDIQEGIIVPGDFNRLLANIHPPGPGRLEGS